MAKKKSGGPNKSQAIRDYNTSNPSAKPKQIAEDLSKQGISVSAGFVSTILSTSKRKKKVARPGRPKGSVKSVRAVGRPAKAKSNGDVSVDSLLKVKQLVAEIGGIDEAKSALSTLEKLMG
ncbi:hypothetical protein [Rubripirellula lacrimiformis]|nr:hypothetical protein [Rubripirellula lacrimiformis]